MSDNTMPEHIIAGYGFHGYEWSLPDSVMAYRLESVTEYINADALRAKLGGYHDSDLLSLAESLRTFHDNAEATMERMQLQLAERDARIAELEAKQWDVIAQKFIDLDEHIMATAASVGCDSVASMAREITKARARIAELEAAQAWVSVDERLPDDDSKGAIVWTDNGSDYESFNFDLAFYHKSFGWLLSTEWEHGDPTVTHWMPLPPPPVTPET